MTLQQIAEYFHLTFILFLSRKVDRRYYILKGGCNLRFFFKSPRYSEDIDFDLQDMPVGVFQEEVNNILKSKSFIDSLAAAKIKIEHITEHKQTSTTQRWKFGLQYNQMSMPIPTKIEFSRRDKEKGNIKFESIDNYIINEYGLPPILIYHYTQESALLQKLGAIYLRNVPQARDVFDIYLLLTSTVYDMSIFKNISKVEVSKIIENILSIDYSSFKSKVVSYLKPEDVLSYDSKEVWDTMSLKVIESIEKGRE